MTDLNIGDKVIYRTEHGDFWDGSTGTVVEVNCDGFNDVVHSVCWETGRAWEYQQIQYPGRGFVRNFGVNIHLLEQPYDPTQMGDTDDDI
jgi:hypothetical protein